MNKGQGLDSTSISTDMWQSPFFDETFVFHVNGRLFRGKLEPPVTSRNALMMGHDELPQGASVRHAMGLKKPGPFCVTTGADILLSEALAASMRAAGLTGWDAKWLNLYSRKGELLGRYGVFQVVARSGPVQDELAEWLELERPKERPRYWRRTGIFIDPASAPGTDFFTAPTGGWIFATLAVKRFMKRHKVPGVEFTSLREHVIETALGLDARLGS